MHAGIWSISPLAQVKGAANVALGMRHTFTVDPR